MNYNKQAILQLPETEKIALAMELLEVNDQKNFKESVPDWKVNLIRERFKHHEEHPDAGADWNELRKKYLA